MSYSREQVKAITDKILNMCKADAVEVDFSGGERSATRYANSTITANLVENDQQVQITVYYGQKSATTSTHQFDDASLTAAIEQVQALARRKPDNPELMPVVKPPQEYLPVDAALPAAVTFGPGERAQMVRKSVEICEKKGVLGAGYIPKMHWTQATANSEGLFSYYRWADASFILTCRTPDGTGSGWAGTTNVKDPSLIDAVALTTIAADKAVKSQKPRAVEPGNYTVILEPRPAARFLSLALGAFNARAAEEGRSFMSGKERGQTRLGEKVFGDNITIRSAIDNPILRQTPVGPDGLAWVGRDGEILFVGRAATAPVRVTGVGRAAVPPAVADRSVYAVDAGGVVRCATLDAPGKTAWSSRLPGPAVAAPLPVGDLLVVRTEGAVLGIER